MLLRATYPVVVPTVKSVTVRSMAADQPDEVAPSVTRPRAKIKAVESGIKAESETPVPETPLVPTRETYLYRQMKKGEKPELHYKATERTYLTPELAKWLLTLNHERNRNLSQDRAERIGRTIVAGEWRFLGDPIVVSESGALINGQHRVSGTVIANKPIEVIIQYGVPDAELAWMDHMRPRSAAEGMIVEGLLKSKKGAPSITVLHWLDHNDFNLRPEPFEKRATLIKHLEGLKWAIEHVPSKIENPSMRADRKEIRAAFAYCHPFAKTKLPTLLQRYITGEGLTKTNPMMVMRNLMGDDGVLVQPGETDKNRICRILRCLEAGLKETPLTTNRVDEGVLDRVRDMRKKAGVE